MPKNQDIPHTIKLGSDGADFRTVVRNVSNKVLSGFSGSPLGGNGFKPVSCASERDGGALDRGGCASGRGGGASEWDGRASGRDGCASGSGGGASGRDGCAAIGCKTGKPVEGDGLWTVPEVHRGKEWFVYFNAWDGASGRMKRKRYMMDGIRNLTERRRKCREVVRVLHEMLRAGWDAWGDPGRGKAAVWMIVRGRCPEGASQDVTSEAAAVSCAAARMEAGDAFTSGSTPRLYESGMRKREEHSEMERGAAARMEAGGRITREWARAFPDAGCVETSGSTPRLYESGLRKRGEHSEVECGAAWDERGAVKGNVGARMVMESAAGQAGTMTLGMARAVYVRWVDRMCEAGVLRQASAGRYGSYMHVFFGWAEGRGLSDADVRVMEGPRVVRAFLDYLLLETTASACTHNNYLSWLCTFCDWMRERGYIVRCGTEGVRKLREPPKKREQLTPTMLRQMREYLQGAGKLGFMLACYMEYYTFIRPKELTYIRIRDIEVAAQRVTVYGDWTKNRRDAAVALNDTVLALMVGNGVFGHDGEEYLFSTGFVPGRKRLNPGMFRNEWLKIREALGWPDCYQFYSLKDTGIRDLANAEGIVVARDQARHADISTTNRYLKGAGMTVHREAQKFRGGL